jgi:dolichol-phosphate mannosyltransferase
MIRRVSRATVCLPTYDERENLEPMVRALGEVLGPDDRVLVIDDSSPDGTGEIADRLAAELDWVDVLHRPRKEGLGRAYLDGFRRALADGAELVLEMDCDFSHDPNEVPRLIAAAEGADLVLGSRYVAGGGTENWGLVRRAISRWGSLYAQVLLGLRVRDLTGGFKCYRRRVLETIELDAIRSRGYAFQIETTYRALRAGFRVVEIPIRFTDREVGGSKMSRSIVLEAIWKVPAMRLASRRWSRDGASR